MSFGTSPGAELTADLNQVFTQIRVLQARALDIVGEMDRRNVANEAGYSGLAAFLMETVRVSRKAANRMIKQAEQIAQTVTPTGHTTPASLPLMREAMHDGVVDVEHLDVVAEVVRQLPDWATLADRTMVETTLTTDARETHPNAVRKLGEQIIPGSTKTARHPPNGSRPNRSTACGIAVPVRVG